MTLVGRMGTGLQKRTLQISKNMAKRYKIDMKEQRFAYKNVV
jgi:hypothetical protein